jgi:hypothetical protein
MELKGKHSQAVAKTIEAKKAIRAKVDARDCVVTAVTWGPISDADGSDYSIKAEIIELDSRIADGVVSADPEMQLIIDSIKWEPM